MRTLDELLSADPAWPNKENRGASLLPLQFTTRSPRGAIVYETGGLLVDRGWLRMVGSGSPPRLPRSIPDWNEDKAPAPPPPWSLPRLTSAIAEAEARWRCGSIGDAAWASVDIWTNEAGCMTTSLKCPLCGIARGSIRRATIARDDLVIAFMSLHAIRPGHVVVMPLEHRMHVDELPADVVERIFRLSQQMAVLQRRVYSPIKVGLLASGFMVPDHFHVHVVPLHDRFDVTAGALMREGIDESTDVELDEQAEKLRRELRSSRLPLQPSGSAGG